MSPSASASFLAAKEVQSLAGQAWWLLALVLAQLVLGLLALALVLAQLVLGLLALC